MNWKVLGGVNVAPIPSGADEPKAEELPDGSILCSSRIYGGRAYNIFHFTNSEKAEGYWDKRANSNASNNGVIAESNSCNGETMIVPATRKADGKTYFSSFSLFPSVVDVPMWVSTTRNWLRSTTLSPPTASLLTGMVVTKAAT